MYILPFIYFLSLTAYLWRRHRTFDVSVYMCSLYTLTSFCAIILVQANMLDGGGILFYGWEPDLGVVPTFLYCFLLTITILPFSFIRTEKITRITNSHPLIIYGFVAILFFQALLNLYLVVDSTMDILNGDLRAVRESHYGGDMSLADIKLESLPGVLRYFNYMNPSTILALPLFFYYSCMEKRSLWLTVPLLFISLSGPVKAIQSVDRAELIFYGQMFLYCIVFFRNMLTASLKRLLLIGGIPFVGLSLVYLTAVSTERFEDREEGTSGSILQYAGQSYLNFCYFYDNADPNLIYPQREFPVISHIFFHSDYGELKEERSAKEGFFIGVFATHVGSWLIDIGLVGCTVYATLFGLICTLLIKYYNRKEYEITEVLFLFIFATTPIFGIFYYRFHGIAIGLQYVFVGMLYILSRYRFVWGGNNQQSES